MIFVFVEEKNVEHFLLSKYNGTMSEDACINTARELYRTLCGENNMLSFATRELNMGDRFVTRCLHMQQSQSGDATAVHMNWMSIKTIGRSIGLNDKNERAANQAIGQASLSSYVNKARLLSSLTLKEKVYALNNLRFAIVDVLIRKLKNEFKIKAQYNGSRYYDSDIDITISIQNLAQDPVSVLRRIIEKVVGMSMEHIDEAAMFDINVYLANFKTSKDIDCSSFASRGFGRSSSSFLLDSLPKRSMSSLTKSSVSGSIMPAHIAGYTYDPYAFFRIKTMFDNNNLVKRRILRLENDLMEWRSQCASTGEDPYTKSVQQYYNAVCEARRKNSGQSNADDVDLHYLLFMAMVHAKDQYYTNAAYMLVVDPLLSSDPIKTEQQNKIDCMSEDPRSLFYAAWDNFGMLYHTLQNSVCDEPNWASKVAKYMTRINKWTQTPNASLSADLAEVRASSSVDHLVHVISKAACTLGSEANNALLRLTRELFFSRPPNVTPQEQDEKLHVLEVCFHFMIKHFDPFPQGGAGSRQARRKLVPHTKSALYHIASKLSVRGRSTMTKWELEKAIVAKHGKKHI